MVLIFKDLCYCVLFSFLFFVLLAYADMTFDLEVGMMDKIA